MKKAVIAVLACFGAMSWVVAAEIRQQPQVETNGLTRKIIAEHVLSGPLSQLNGKYKMVAVDFAIAPGGYVGPHHHAGPGYRCVTHGVVTNVEEDGKSTDYHPGECYFEGGDKSHVPRNNGDTMVLGVQVELLPANWSGSSLLPVGAGESK